MMDYYLKIRHVELLALLATVALGRNAAGQSGDFDRKEGPVSSRIIQKERVVPVTPPEAFRLWSTEEGVTSISPPKAKIELRPGGAYEWYFVPDAPAGLRGGEGCTVLAFIPDRMIAFTWNAPPTIPRLRESGAKSQVIVEFSPVAGGTHVRFTQHGFGDGEDWEAYYNYFVRAWDRVLDGMKKWCDAHPSPGMSASTVNSTGMKTFAYQIAPARADFIGTATEAEAKSLAGHAAYIDSLTKEGVVVFAGRTDDPAMIPPLTGAIAPLELPSPMGVVVFRAESVEAARRIVDVDPAIRDGVLKVKLSGFLVVAPSN